ncbi:hypothetical protein [Flavicella sp.]|uniref:hypothetical protein n=1 Tax=Flavicella sp. TaxID=2957742 RepID=UPI003016FE38
MIIQIDGVNTQNKGAELMLVAILDELNVRYPNAAATFYMEESKVAGISLYSYEYEELGWYQFYPKNLGTDNFFMQWAASWGLSSCAINWPDIEHLEKRMENTLGLEKYQRPIMCMAVGFPDTEGKVAYSEKRNIDLIRKYN